jgi:signal transduction histidine kinase/ActR/RegA family two-component response regulator
MAQRRAAFLAEASAVLTSSLDCNTTLDTIARLAVPTFADWCVVELVNEHHGSRTVSVAHCDPAKVELAWEMDRRYPPDPNAPRGPAQVLRTGQSELYPEINDALLVQSARDTEHLAILRALKMSSVMIVPLAIRGRTFGALTFVAAESGYHYGTDDLLLAEDLGRRAALAVDNARLFRGAQEAVHLSEEALHERELALQLHRDAEQQLTLLVEASASLTSSLELSAVLTAILDLSKRLFAADAYAIWRHQRESRRWSIVSASGLSEDYMRTAGVMSQTDVVMSEHPIVVEDVEQAPSLEDRRPGYRSEGVVSLLVVPLRIHGLISGTLTFYYRRPHTSSPIEIRVATALANLAASALGTAELYETQNRLRVDAEKAQRRLAFLAEASNVLASSLDSQATLERSAQLVVPYLADWCIVDILEADGSIRQAAVGHRNPETIRWAWELNARYPDNPKAPAGVPRVIRTGQAELFPEIPDSLLCQVARDEEHLRIIRQLGLKSGMIVPLMARGRVLGTISLGITESDRRYGPEDLALAQELARRAAVAVDNARLYGAVQEADRRKEEFLAMLAHELRNPLAPIRTAAQVLRRLGEDTPGIRQSQDIIERQVQHLARLVDDLLDVSRITRGKIELHKESIDLAAALTRAVETVRPMIEDRRHELTMDLPLEPIFLEGDLMRLAQVFANLLGNAAKFTENGGKIVIRATREGTRAVIKVTDTGIGIPADLLPRVFDLFTQGDRSLARSEGGLGIGLTLVRSLVEMHGGTVEAFSDGPGRGSEFIMYLPVLEVAALNDRTPEPVAGRLQPPHQRVLIVDDNADAAESMAMLLRALGHEVRTAPDGPAALERARAFQPDMVLLDIGLPRMDGYEVARRLRGEAGLCKVLLVALTGYGQDEDRRRTREAGFDHHLVKPIDWDDLEPLLQENADGKGPN